MINHEQESGAVEDSGFIDVGDRDVGCFSSRAGTTFTCHAWRDAKWIAVGGWVT